MSIHSRGGSPGYAAIEQLHIRRDVGEHRLERIVEQFEPRDLGIAQIDDHGRALRNLDACLRIASLSRGTGGGAGSSSIARSDSVMVNEV